MIKYLVDAPFVVIPDGKIKLDKARANIRAHKLEHIEDDTYLIKEGVTFKRGEIIELDTEPSKIVRGGLINLTEEEEKTSDESGEQADQTNASNNVKGEAAAPKSNQNLFKKKNK